MHIYEFFSSYTQCPEKDILDTFDCYLKKDYQILIIFDINISNTTSN